MVKVFVTKIPVSVKERFVSGLQVGGCSTIHSCHWEEQRQEYCEQLFSHGSSVDLRG